ncbi:anthranilate synthase component 2/para-aminobenzoate synthetase component 2 [Arboricoccus pini]|uniref:Anthranilate synthase component 2/para-aminobenzoate synthetase component 2 n=1 Tax=Arboricoccus pini TaxID=1963835 RepID=A0A212R312_9PROT|nr:aminodeoxychorismate/anthranilate synthase component II [Arboricoccus pini]SNB66261.1 anthranilate synthase component 2/para-aminobenzoate synthetase component 2 [Arboricoccus pini]
MIVLIDNYDSFVFNVARYLEELGNSTDVVRNDAIDVAALEAKEPEAIILSPGPCTPNEAGVSLDIVSKLSGKIPLLGICLGHQCIGQAFGGEVGRARYPMHGRSSLIAHPATGLFEGLPSPLAVGRYHSLIVDFDETANADLAVTARSSEGEIMALQHKKHPTVGIQFHPESILTEHGHHMLANFVAIAKAWRRVLV